MAQGGVAPGRESRVTGRASKRLDPFGAWPCLAPLPECGCERL